MDQLEHDAEAFIAGTSEIHAFSSTVYFLKNRKKKRTKQITPPEINVQKEEKRNIKRKGCSLQQQPKKRKPDATDCWFPFSPHGRKDSILCRLFSYLSFFSLFASIFFSATFSRAAMKKIMQLSGLQHKAFSFCQLCPRRFIHLRNTRRKHGDKGMLMKLVCFVALHACYTRIKDRFM